MSERVEIVATPWYEAERERLGKEDQDRVERRLTLLRDKRWGDALRDETVKHLREGIYEVRVLGRGSAFRLLFFLAPGRSPRLVVLTTCVAKSVVKKRQRMDAEIQRAMDRRGWWLEEQLKKKQESHERG